MKRIDVADGDDFSIFDADHIVTAGFGDDVGALVERLRNYMKCVVMTESLCDLTLICPGLFKHISKDQGVWVELGFFGNDLLWNDLPYSKGFMKFKCLKPSKIMLWGKKRTALFRIEKFY